MISLRRHHFICLHFFTGEGYNREFIENLYAVLDRAKDEPVVVIVRLIAPLQHLP
ncbi:hypothetical protein [Thermodesulfovibrio sp. TK110]